MKNIHDDSDKIIEQMVNGIVGKEKSDISVHEKEIRNQLAGRAAEYLMFMDDDESDAEK